MAGCMQIRKLEEGGVPTFPSSTPNTLTPPLRLAMGASDKRQQQVKTLPARLTVASAFLSSRPPLISWQWGANNGANAISASDELLV